MSRVLRGDGVRGRAPFEFIECGARRVGIRGVREITYIDEDFLERSRAVVALGGLLSGDVRVSLARGLNELADSGGQVRCLISSAGGVAKLSSFSGCLALLFRVSSLVVGSSERLGGVTIVRGGKGFSCYPVFSGKTKLLSGARVCEVSVSPGNVVGGVITDPFFVAFGERIGAIRSLCNAILGVPGLAGGRVARLMGPCLGFCPRHSETFVGSHIIYYVARQRGVVWVRGWCDWWFGSTLCRLFLMARGGCRRWFGY